LGFVTEFLFFVLAAIAFQLFEIEITYQRWISAAIVLFVTAVFVMPTIPKIISIVFTATFFAEMYLNHEFLFKRQYFEYCKRIMFNASQLTVVIFAGTLVFRSLGGIAPPWSRVDQYLLAIVTFVTCNLLNTAFVSAVISLSTGISFLYPFKFDLNFLPIQVLSLGVLSILSATLYSISLWHMILVLIPMGLFHYSLWGYTRLRRSAVEAFEKLMKTLKWRDEYTATHSERVAELAAKIARKLRLPQEEIERIRAAARIHDIGKVAIPDDILLKKGPLTPEERKIIEKHPLIGADIIQGLEVYKDCVDIVKYEHERWDGSGYPERLKGEDIPLGARIVAVADVYDALRSERPYRRELSADEAAEEIKRMRGRELDPRVVDALLQVLEEEGEVARGTERSLLKRASG